MKRSILLTLTVLLVVTLFGYSSNNKTIIGKYKFDKIVYLSLLSSSSVDYMGKQMEGTEYIIGKDSFEIVNPKKSIKYKNIDYKKVKMDDDLVKAFNEAVFEMFSISKYKEKYQYIMYEKGDNKVNYYLYSMDDELWVASYVDNTANGADIINDIYKLT